jgi:hypothetical protein
VQNENGTVLTLIDNSVSGMESVSGASILVHPRLHTGHMMEPVTTWRTLFGVGPHQGWGGAYRILKLRQIRTHTDKKETNIFLINKEIQIGSVAKSYMRKGFLLHEEMRKYLVIYEYE